MSDTLSSLLALVTGAAPMTLGSVSFKSFEVPDKIQYGGTQRHTMHRLIGGQRVFDVMGDDPNDISWSGKMIGPDAQARRLVLDTLRADGEIVQLNWSDIELDVLVSEATFSEGFHWIDYQITCKVHPDDPDTPAPSAHESLLDSVGGALGLDLSGALATAQPYLNSAQTALQSVSTLIPASAAGLAVSGALTQVGSIATAGQVLASGNLAGLASNFTGGQFSGLLQAAGQAANSGALGGLAGQGLSVLRAQ